MVLDLVAASPWPQILPKDMIVFIHSMVSTFTEDIVVFGAPGTSKTSLCAPRWECRSPGMARNCRGSPGTARKCRALASLARKCREWRWELAPSCSRLVPTEINSMSCSGLDDV